MKRVAIVVASQYGQTTKIANRIGSQFRERGWEFELIVATEPIDMQLERFDAVVIGAPVYIGRFTPLIVDWTRKNAPALNSMKAAFFSVSLNAADKRPHARITDSKLLSDFVDETGLIPDWVASFAGCIHYTKYGFFKRWMLKRICGAAGGPTDTSRDHEMTDWDQVVSFADDIAAGNRSSAFAADRRLRPSAHCTNPGAFQVQ